MAKPAREAITTVVGTASPATKSEFSMYRCISTIRKTAR